MPERETHFLPARPDIPQVLIEVIKTSPETPLSPDLAQTLRMPSEIKLTPEQKEEILDFERDLTSGTFTFPRQHYDEKQKKLVSEEVTANGIETGFSMQVKKSEFFLEYFLSEKGRLHLAIMLLPAGQTQTEKLSQAISEIPNLNEDLARNLTLWVKDVNDEPGQQSLQAIISGIDTKDKKGKKLQEIFSNIQPALIDQKKALEEALRTTAGFNNIGDVASFLYGFDYSQLVSTDEEVSEGDEDDDSGSAGLLSDLSGSSRNYAKELFVEQLSQSSFTSVEEVDNPNCITVIRDPNLLVNKIKNLRDLDDYHRFLSRQFSQKQRELDEDGQVDPVFEAKKVILEVHTRRLNQLIGEVYGEAVWLKRQGDSAKTSANIQACDQMVAILKKIGLFDERRATRYLSLIDKFIYGKGTQKIEGNYTVVNTDMIKTIERELDNQNAQPIQSYILKDYDKNLFTDTKVSPEELVKWFKQVLLQWGLLSSDPDSSYSKDREGYASDGKFQVVFDPAVHVLTMSNEQRVIQIPAQMAPKSLIDAVASIEHEGMHTVQEINRPEVIPLEIAKKVRMDRSAVYTEGGAVAKARQCREVVFGERRPIRKHYLAAVKERIRNGSFKDCVKAYFDSAVAENKTKNKRSLARTAFNSATRIFRNGGILSENSQYITNSKALVYLEQELAAHKLRQSGLEALLFVSGSNIEMAAKLYRLGLFNLEAIKTFAEPEGTNISSKPENKLIHPWEVLLPEIKRKLTEQKEVA